MMTKTIQDTPEDDQPWLREIEEDSAEAARFEFENTHALIEGNMPIQRKSSLIAKMEADPKNSFNVTSYSRYNEDRWILEKPANTRERRILFMSDLAGGNELKKMLTYHLIPQFHPLGTLRSFVSTETYAWAYSLLEKHVFIPNGLDATPESIKVISPILINEALDRAKAISSPRSYFLLYFIISFWQMLSANALIPSSQRLDVSLHLIDTPERQADIRNTIASEHKGWRPFTEEELSRLIEHALFWSQSALPILLKVKTFLEEHVVPERKHSWFVKSSRWAEFEELLGKKVNGVTICGFTHRLTTTKVVSPYGKLHEYTANQYFWKRPYKRAVDKVKDAILIFLALITGLRRRELGILYFDNVTQRDSGEWVISVTRFKTSNDPNYFGSSETLPLPSFIGEILDRYRQLRSFDGNMRSGLIFEQVVNSKKTRLVDRSIGKAMSNLGDAVGVVGIHPHRCRPTIAEILINRSERNIDLIRMLFGHRSYTMTLRYIARNPYLVHSIAETMEAHYTEAFVEIAAAVQRGAYSGEAAERIAATAKARPDIFKGTLLRITVFNYISYLLESGEPVFIKRTGVGTYCVSTQTYASDNRPPCLANANMSADFLVPDPSNCQLHCKNAIVLEEARETLEKNIAFYSKLLDQSAGKLRKAAETEIISKININERHLSALDEQRNNAVSDPTETLGRL
jgi:integrase